MYLLAPFATLFFFCERVHYWRHLTPEIKKRKKKLFIMKCTKSFTFILFFNNTWTRINQGRNEFYYKFSYKNWVFYFPFPCLYVRTWMNVNGFWSLFSPVWINSKKWIFHANITCTNFMQVNAFRHLCVGGTQGTKITDEICASNRKFINNNKKEYFFVLNAFLNIF